MKNIFLLLTISFLLLGCGNDDEYPMLHEASNLAKDDTPQKDHDMCLNKNFYPACKNLAFLYENGGRYNEKIVIEKDMEKAKFYQKVLCEKYQKEHFCKKIK